MIFGAVFYLLGIILLLIRQVFELINYPGILTAKVTEAITYFLNSFWFFRDWINVSAALEVIGALILFTVAWYLFKIFLVLLKLIFGFFLIRKATSMLGAQRNQIDK